MLFGTMEPCRPKLWRIRFRKLYRALIQSIRVFTLVFYENGER
jgi:hypothetical protein